MQLGARDWNLKPKYADKSGGLVSMDIALASVCNVGELHTGAHQEGILTTCHYSSTSKEFLNLILSIY